MRDHTDKISRIYAVYKSFQQKLALIVREQKKYDRDMQQKQDTTELEALRKKIHSL